MKNPSIGLSSLNYGTRALRRQRLRIIAEDYRTNGLKYVYLRDSRDRNHDAGLSPLPGTAASAAWNPTLEWVPSQNGLVVEPPQRHKANGRRMT